MNNEITRVPVTVLGEFHENALCPSPEEEYNYTYIKKYRAGENNTIMYNTNPRFKDTWKWFIFCTNIILGSY